MFRELLSIITRINVKDINVVLNGPKISHLTKTDLCWVNGKLRWKCCRGDFSIICQPWKRWLTKGVLKQELSGIQVTIFLGVNNFQNISAIKVIFFSKCAKFYEDCKNAIKIPENVQSFWDNGVGTCCSNFSQ